MLGEKHAQMGPGRVVRDAGASTATRSERVRLPESATGRQSAKRLHLEHAADAPRGAAVAHLLPSAAGVRQSADRRAEPGGVTVAPVRLDGGEAPEWARRYP